MLGILLSLILPQAGVSPEALSLPEMMWRSPGGHLESGVLCPGYMPGVCWDLSRTKSGAAASVSESAARAWLSSFIDRWDERIFRSAYKEPHVQYLPCLFRKGESGRISVRLYGGVVQAPQSGMLRFVGRGGDVTALRFDGQLLLQSSGGEAVSRYVTVEAGKLYLLEWLTAEWSRGVEEQSLYTEWRNPDGHAARFLFRTANAPLPDGGEAPVWKLFHSAQESL